MTDDSLSGPPAANGDPKQRLRAGFDNLAPTYDQLAFLQRSARRFGELAQLQPGAHVLDVATGTGEVALFAAQAVGPSGHVAAIDLSPAMLAQAQRKLDTAGQAQVALSEGDAAQLTFPDNSFDVVLCGAAVFFLPDMAAALREWRRVLRPAGLVGISSFGASFVQPLRALWEAQLATVGLSAAYLPTQRLGDAAACIQLLRETGYVEAKVYEEQLGYHLPTVAARWDDIMAGLEGKPLLALPAAQQAHIRTQHLADLADLTGNAGLWVDVPALFAFARKAPG